MSININRQPAGTPTGGQFTAGSTGEATVDLGGSTSPAVLDPEGPGGWGSYSSATTLGHDVTTHRLDGTEVRLAAGQKVTVRTDFTNRGEGEAEPDQPLRFATTYEVDGVDHVLSDSSHTTLVDASDPEEARLAALERIHNAMRWASEHESPHAEATMATQQAWQGAHDASKGQYALSEDTMLAKAQEANDRAFTKAAKAREEATQTLQRTSLVGAAISVRREFPEAQTLILEDDYEGGVWWAATDGAGNELGDLNDGEIADTLWEYSAGLDLNRPFLLEPHAKGHDPAEQFDLSGAIEVDRGGTVRRLEVDIDQMINATAQQ